MSSTVHILGFAGSLRKKSYNRATLKVAQELMPEGAELEIITLDDLPLFNEDHENNEPEVVRNFKEKIHEADALLIATPEYNYSTSGVLKNAIDWASRPTGRSVLEGKPAAIMGAGGRFGTVRAQMNLRQVFLYLHMPVLMQPDVHIFNAWEKFDSDGNLTDEIIREQIRALLLALISWTKQHLK
ncbi:MAG: NADPH-dependent FMN reductase [Ktedonobacteraceae bacterium]